MFQSGIYDIDPSLLENVIAMSSSDSIYIGGALLYDPQELAADIFWGYSARFRQHRQPGMAFLIPPVETMIREVKMADWFRIDRDEFDGDMRDCFESTSLHLSFTGAKHSCKFGLLRWTGCGCLSAGDADFTKRWW